MAQEERSELLPPDVRDKLVATLDAAAGLINPVAGLVVAAGDLAAAEIRGLLARWRSTPEQELRQRPEQLLLDTIHTVTADGPTVLAFEDLTSPGRELIWAASLYHANRMRDRRVLVLVGVDGPEALEPSNSDDPLDGFAPVLWQVRQAVREKRASWWPIAWLSPSRVQDWLGPVDVDVAERLVAVGGADDVIAAQVWHRWVESGHVRKDSSGQWARTTVDEPVERNIEDVLFARLSGTEIVPVDVEAIDLARRALELASLSGPRFSAAAVGEVLSAHQGAVASEQVQNLLDELTPANGQPWLIDTADHAAVGSGADRSWHWVYRFAAEYWATFLAERWAPAHDGRTRQEVAVELLGAIRRVHHDHPLFDSCCYHLARSAGQRREAGRYASRMASADRQRHLVVRAHLLLSIADDDLLATDDVITTTADCSASVSSHWPFTWESGVMSSLVRPLTSWFVPQRATSTGVAWPGQGSAT
jgi:hypothetical protein